MPKSETLKNFFLEGRDNRGIRELSGYRDNRTNKADGTNWNLGRMGKWGKWRKWQNNNKVYRILGQRW